MARRLRMVMTVVVAVLVMMVLVVSGWPLSTAPLRSREVVGDPEDEHARSPQALRPIVQGFGDPRQDCLERMRHIGHAYRRCVPLQIGVAAHSFRRL